MSYDFAVVTYRILLWSWKGIFAKVLFPWKNSVSVEVCVLARVG